MYRLEIIQPAYIDDIFSKNHSLVCMPTENSIKSNLNILYHLWKLNECLFYIVLKFYF